MAMSVAGEGAGQEKKMKFSVSELLIILVLTNLPSPPPSM